MTTLLSDQVSEQVSGVRDATPEAALERDWATNPRWAGITRPYRAADVIRLRGSIQIEHTLARLGAERLWQLLQEELYVAALGALTGNQAVQQVKAGIKAIYLSGWQVAADANLSGQMYPDQSLYPANSVPHVVERINQALQRADQIHHAEGKNGVYWFAPIIADAEAGFGGPLNCFELMKAMIEAGRPARPASTSKTSSPPKRSAATWAARCSCPRRPPSRISRRRGWRPTCWACPRCSSHGRMLMAPS